MRNCVLFVLICSFTIIPGCETQKNPSNQVTVIGNPNGETSGNIETKVGQSFIIILPSNITTGYSWRLAEPQPKILEMVSKKYKTPEETGNIVGAAGKEEWIFRAIEKGTASLLFEYVRPWEKDQPPDSKAAFVILVE